MYEQYSKANSRIERHYRNAHKILDHSGICVFCGDSFKSAYPLSKYCSGRCKNDRQILEKKERNAERRTAAATCSICQKPILQNGAKISHYCSAACKQKAYRLSLKKAC